MKKKYLFPEAYFILLLSRGIVTTSDENVFIEENDQGNDDIVPDPFTPTQN